MKSAISTKMEGASEAPVYPLYPLESSIEIGEAVKQLGGLRTPVSKSVLASHLKLPESQVLNQRIGAAKCFGIIRGRAEYTLGDAAKQYFFPTQESDKAAALLGFLNCPSAFQHLIDRFDGQKLPDSANLGNILLGSNVPESWSNRVAGFFVRSAKYAKAIDETGHLRYAASMLNLRSKNEPTNDQTSQSANEPSATAPKATRLENNQSRQSDQQTVELTSWVFAYRDGSYIRLDTPKNISPDLWRKLRGYVDLLKPDDEPDSSRKE